MHHKPKCKQVTYLMIFNIWYSQQNVSSRLDGCPSCSVRIWVYAEKLQFSLCPLEDFGLGGLWLDLNWVLTWVISQTAHIFLQSITLKLSKNCYGLEQSKQIMYCLYAPQRTNGTWLWSTSFFSQNNISAGCLTQGKEALKVSQRQSSGSAARDLPPVQQEGFR